MEEKCHKINHYPQCFDKLIYALKCIHFTNMVIIITHSLYFSGADLIFLKGYSIAKTSNERKPTILMCQS